MRLLDLFCGAGGAAMGYHRAGFDEIVGVDIVRQKNYPFTFIQGDALNPPVRLEDFDLIHASPPCQRYSAASNIHNSSSRHPDLITPTRQALIRSGRPWLMENVERSPLNATLVLCGSMFGLGVRRHRPFESNQVILTPPCGSHDLWYASVFGGRAVGRQQVTHLAKGQRQQTWTRFKHELAVASDAMGIDWMTISELSEAIPPAYTEYLGRQFLDQLARAS